MFRLVLSAALSSFVVTAALPAQQLTARDAFWSASDLISVAPNPSSKTAVKSQRAPVPAQKSATASTMRPREPRTTAQLVAINGYGEQPHLLKTSLKTQQLGLRYSILKQQQDGTFAETIPDDVFHEGDSVRLSIMSNEPGYLYVIHQGSSGSWSPIFPDSRSGSNHVEPGTPYQVPGDPQKFRFDNRPGTEKLFVVLSRDPIADLSGTLDRMKNSATSERKPVPDAGQLLEASNKIPDELVQRLASRDLTLVTEQKIDATGQAAALGEKAVYVVARQDAQSPAHEVVTRIMLTHQ